MQLSTLPVAVCYGVGDDITSANNDAARNALNYLKMMTKNKAITCSTTTSDAATSGDKPAPTSTEEVKKVGSETESVKKEESTTKTSITGKEQQNGK